MSVIDFLRFQIPKIYWCLIKKFPLRMILCDVDFKSVPKSTRFVHPYGITIREGTILGENCIIHQNVTIGQKKTEEKRAVLGDNVNIGAGAILLGPVTIGDNVVIAAGAIVVENIPTNVTYISKHTILLKI